MPVNAICLPVFRPYLVRFHLLRFHLLRFHLLRFDVLRFDVLRSHIVRFDVVRSHALALTLLLTVVGGVGVAPADAQTRVTVDLFLSQQAYAMGDLHAWQRADVNALVRQTGVRPRSVQAFPSRWAPHGAVRVQLHPGVRVGGRLGYSATGGRVSYVDYSGEYRFDQTSRRWFGGPLAEVRLARHATADLALWAGASLTYSRSTLTEERLLQIGRSTDSASTESTSAERASIDLVADGVGVTPRLMGEWEPGPVRVHVHLAYEWSVGNRLTYRDQRVSVPGVDTPRLDWSGFRYGVGLGVAFESLGAVIK